LRLAANHAPGGTKTNLQSAIDAGVTFDDRIAEPLRLVLCDAQTSGGLLIAIAPDRCDALVDALHERGVPAAQRVGVIEEKPGIRIGA
jgi:selenide,water dikinase